MSSSLAMPQEGKGEPRPGFAWESAEFGAIYEAHSQVIYYLALRLLGDAALAQDATHDVFLKAFRKMDTFRGEAGIRTWLYRITINHCQNMNQSWHARHMFSNADEAVWETAGAGEGGPLRGVGNKEMGQGTHATREGVAGEKCLLVFLGGG